jgi:hypothetical protein
MTAAFVSELQKFKCKMNSNWEMGRGQKGDRYNRRRHLFSG